MTRVTVIDAEVGSNPTGVAGKPAEPAHPAGDLENAIVHVITQDPFVTIKEIKTEINNRPGNLSAGWWEIFAVLRRRKLLTKRSRFRLIFGRR